MDGPDHGVHYAPTPGLDMVKAVPSHAAASKGGFGTTTPGFGRGSVASSRGACVERAGVKEADSKIGKMSKCTVGMW